VSTPGKSSGKEKGKGQPSRPAAPSSAPRRAWRINPRALTILGGVLLVVMGVGVTAWFMQVSSGKAALLAEAKKLSAENKDDRALAFLKEYLNRRPGDLDALDLRAEILARSARSTDQYQAAIRALETILRVDSNSQSERVQNNRRRLINACLEVAPQVNSIDRKLSVAEFNAQELVKATHSAADMRLYAKTLELIQFLGKTDVKQLDQAADLYENARKLDPGNVAADEQLARLYARMKQPQKADAVIESLLKTTPTAPAFLVGARYYSTLAQEALSSGRSAEAPAAREKAAALVKQAVTTAPKDLEIRLAAAELALADRRPGEAALHLDAVPVKDQQDYRYLTLRGVISLYENKTTDAIDNWTRGLSITNGSQADLSWRLAYVLLQLGRVGEADDLIKQYRRLLGTPVGNAGNDVPPPARFLEGLKLLKSNEPVKAIAELAKARVKLPDNLKPQLHYTLGLAQEAVRDESAAMDEFQLALAADPKYSPARLAAVRLYQISGRGDEALDEVRKGLAESGDDPSLLTALARLELDRQRRLPSGKRSWGELEATLARGKEAAPSAAALAIVRAAAMAEMGKPEAAADLLAQATNIDKADPELWAAYAERLVALGKLDQAVQVLDQAVDPKAAGDHANLRILRAKIRTILGHGVEARAELISDLERIRPDQRPQLYMTLGELYAAQGDAKSAQSARQAFADWARLLPDDPLPHIYVLELTLADRSEKSAVDLQIIKNALQNLKRVGGLYQEVGEISYALSDPKILLDASRVSELERRIAGIEKQAPNLRFGPFLMGALMEKKGDLPAAAQAYERTMKTEGGKTVLPRLVNVYNKMGKAGRGDLERLAAANPEAAQGIARAEAEAAAKLGEKERAEALAAQVVAGNPESLELRVWQARLLNSLGESAKAELTLKNLTEKSPESLGPWMALLYFQVSQKNPEAAAKTVEAMIAHVKDLDRPDLVFAQAWRVAGNRERADQLFESGLKRWPDDPRVGRAAAEYYAATLRPDKAEIVLREALRRDETQRWATRGLALVLSAPSDDPTTWRKAWDLIREPAPGGDMPEDRLIRAVVLSRGPEAANRDQAITTLTQLISDIPAELPAAKTARETLVQSLLKTEPKKAAEFAATDARAPNATPAALALHIRALVASDQFEDAGRQLDRLSAAAPGDPATLALRARLFRAQGKKADAVADLEKIAPEKINGPNGELAGKQIIQTLIAELEDDNAALRVAELLVAKYPKSKGLKAAILARTGDRKEALKLLLDVVQDGDTATIIEAAQNSLAQIALDKYDPATIELSKQVIDAALAKDPTNSELRTMTGYVHHYQGRYADELKVYQDVLASKPEDFKLKNNMAWTLSERQNKPEEALKYINEAIRQSGDVPAQFYDTRGCIYTRMGKYDEAIHDLTLATREDPSPTTWAHLARAYKKAGKDAEYTKAKEQAIKAGLTIDMIEKADRPELESILSDK
jgi:predicted Zn-dependent protease